MLGYGSCLRTANRESATVRYISRKYGGRKLWVRHVAVGPWHVRLGLAPPQASSFPFTDLDYVNTTGTEEDVTWSHGTGITEYIRSST